MLVEGKVGPQALSDGAIAQPRLSKDGSFVLLHGHARYQEAALRGNLYFASNQAGIAATAGLSATSTIFTLYNPASSGVNLVLAEVIAHATVDPAADAAVWLVANVTAAQAAPTSTASLVVRNSLIGVGAGKGIAYSTATLAAAPVVIRPLLTGAWGTAVGFANLYVKDEVAGAIIVPPGIYISVQASAVITVAASMTWEEVPLSLS